MDKFMQSDFAETAADLRNGTDAQISATLSNRFNVILGALDIAARDPTDEEIVAGLRARATAMREKSAALELEEQHATTFNRERVQLVHALTYRARRIEDLALMLEKFGDELVSKKAAAKKGRA